MPRVFTVKQRQDNLLLLHYFTWNIWYDKITLPFDILYINVFLIWVEYK